MSARKLTLGLIPSLCVIVGVLALVLPPVALALPEDRTYEMVTPEYKGGFGVSFFAITPPIVAVAPSGEEAIYQSTGTFAGDPYWAGDYLARRGASKWSTSPLSAPAALSTSLGALDVSLSFETVSETADLGPNALHADRTESFAYFAHATAAPDTPSAWEMVDHVLETPGEKPEGLDPEGASADLCHFIFKVAGPLLPEAGPGLPLYELDRGCGAGSGALRPVGLTDEGSLIDATCNFNELGRAGFTASPSRFNAISVDGDEVFFTECLGPEPTSNIDRSTPHQLFVRLGEARTLEVSKPLSEPESCAEGASCTLDAERAGADFSGASEDGSTVFFTTAAPLVAQDTDGATDLYMATIGCPPSEPGCEVARRVVTSLTEVSHDPHVGEAADVQGVVRVAPDGARVDYVAQGVLSEAANAQGELPLKGAENLYVYDRVSGQTQFIARLCSSTGLSGSVLDSRCTGSKTDEGLWLSHDEGLDTRGALAQTAGADGRFLVFATAAQLVAGDKNTARDVYRYDAETDELTRVSHGEGGFDANGNAGSFDATIMPGQFGGSVHAQYEMDTRAISEDGSRIIFLSSAPLSPAAVNGLANLYEWHNEGPGGEGSVSLISGGSAEGAIDDAVLSPSGRDIFFVTTQGLVPQDKDGLADVYDARLNGGFPAQPAEPQPCAGDACQGPLTDPAPLLVPGSASQAPGENLPPPTVSSVSPKPVSHAKPRAKAKCKRGYGRDRRGRCVKVKKRAGNAAAARPADRGMSRGGNS